MIGITRNTRFNAALLVNNEANSIFIAMYSAEMLFKLWGLATIVNVQVVEGGLETFSI
jgi:hypothetical protein